MGVFSGEANPWTMAAKQFSDPGYYIPPMTYHFWFLYYLLMITMISFGVGLLLKQLPAISKRITLVFDPIIQYPFLKLLVFSSLTFLLLFLMKTTWVATSLDFIPDAKTLIFYSFFYLFGWILYKSKQPLGQLKQLDWLFTILGLVLLTVNFLFDSAFSPTATMAVNALLVWLFSFGITGLFIRYGSNHSVRMRYVSDASYWFYIIHLPLTTLIPGLIASWPLPAVVKFLIVLTATALVCALTYHYLVRSTFIGKFLNGRKYPRSVSLNKSADKLNKAA